MKNKIIIKKIIGTFIKTVGKKQFYFILFFGVFSSILTILEPIIFSKIIKQIEDFMNTGIFNKNDTIFIILLWSGYIFFTILIQYIYDYFLIKKNTVKHYINQSNKYSSKIISMEYSEYLTKKQGKIYKIFDRGVMSEFGFLQTILTDFVLHISGIIAIIFILFYIDFKMALLTISMIPIISFLGLFFIKKVSPIQNKLNKKWNSIFGNIGNIMNSFSLTKVLGLENKFKKDIFKIHDNIHKEQLSLDKYWSISNIYSGMIVMIARIIVIGFGVFFVIEGTLSFTNLFIFFAYIGWIYFPLGFLFSRLKELVEKITAIGDMYDELDGIKKDNIDNGKKIKNIKGYIEFNKVNFGYNGIKTLKNVNFKIESGQKIAFVGNTGAGKSTIVNLLFNFWKINSGEILIDGININIIQKKFIRNNIGIVMQDNSLFNMSIKENLLLVKNNATNKELKESILNAEADFVFNLENGIDTVIGERGLKLSGGEKQRLAIARLFLKNPKILILDEATSALDNKTEKLVQKALDKLMKGRTSIVIAHRLSTIQNADKIFMLEDGKIVEEGNYSELMSKKAKFFELANPEHLIIN